MRNIKIHYWKKFPVAMLLVVLFILPVHTIIIRSNSLTQTEESPVVARITDITWDLETIYREFENIDIIIHCTVVYFTVDIEIWNIRNTNQSVAWSSCCEFPLKVNADLVDSNLNFTEWYGCCCLFWYATYPPGLTKKTVSFPFAYEKPNLTELASGVYRVDFYASIPTYGLNITVSESNSSIIYDPFPDNWGYIKEDIVSTTTPESTQPTSPTYPDSTLATNFSSTQSSDSSTQPDTPSSPLSILQIFELSSVLFFVLTLVIIVRRQRMD